MPSGPRRPAIVSRDRFVAGSIRETVPSAELETQTDRRRRRPRGDRAHGDRGEHGVRGRVDPARRTGRAWSTSAFTTHRLPAPAAMPIGSLPTVHGGEDLDGRADPGASARRTPWTRRARACRASSPPAGRRRLPAISSRPASQAARRAPSASAVPPRSIAGVPHARWPCARDRLASGAARRHLPRTEPRARVRRGSPSAVAAELGPPLELTWASATRSSPTAGRPRVPLRAALRAPGRRAGADRCAGGGPRPRAASATTCARLLLRRDRACGLAGRFFGTSGAPRGPSTSPTPSRGSAWCEAHLAALGETRGTSAGWSRPASTTRRSACGRRHRRRRPRSTPRCWRSPCGTTDPAGRLRVVEALGPSTIQPVVASALMPGGDARGGPGRAHRACERSDGARAPRPRIHPKVRGRRPTRTTTTSAGWSPPPTPPGSGIGLPSEPSVESVVRG